MEGIRTPIGNPVRVDPTRAPARESDHLQPSTPDRILEAVGVKLVDVAGALKFRTAASGTFSGSAAAIARTLEQAGFYLQGRSTTRLLDQSADLIRRHPGPSLLIGAAVGFLVARTIRR
jgi:hypothetical protein